jgi:hypothetical protein
MQNIAETRSSETDYAAMHDDFTVLESVQRRILLKKPNKGRQMSYNLSQQQKVSS